MRRVDILLVSMLRAVRRQAPGCAVCLFAAFALSCVRLELKTADDSSDEAEIFFTTDWGGASEIEWPDSVFIAMNKVSDVLKYTFETDPTGAFFADGTEEDGTSDGETLDGSADEDGTGIDGSEDDSTGDDGGVHKYAAYGNYVVLAYTCDKNDYALSGPDSFMDDKSLSVRDFQATVKDLPTDELEVLKDGSALDFNAAYRFIRMPKPLWAAVQRTEVSDTRENVCLLQMKPVQMEVTIAVEIEADSGIGIRSVVAELSGVPATFSLLTGEVDDSDLTRVIFRMEASENGEYEGVAAVPGLFPSGNASLCTGPGILRLSVTAVKDGVKKVLHPAVNIGTLITSASLMERVSGSDGYRVAKRSAKLEVGTRLRIGAESFSGGDGGDGVGKWFDSDGIDVEI